VVNVALGRKKLESGKPAESDVVLVEFPHLPEAPVRLGHVVAWVPPPVQDGAGGGDVAGLVLSEVAPAAAAPARFAADLPAPGTTLRAFGYPEVPPQADGMWVNLGLQGIVGRQLLQVESVSGQTAKAQPGYSGAPVWDSRGMPVGLLQLAPFADEPRRDAYLLAPNAIAEAWEEAFDYLLMPENPYRGLEPFTASHAAMFFGRDADITELTRRVRAQHVTVVAGPSGAGKSSLLQAGLLPALQQDQQWSVALARPGADPWPRLASALLKARGDGHALITLGESETEVERLRRDGFGPAARYLRSLDRPLLVVVDQFEELLASGSPEQELLDLLLPPPEAVDDAVRLVLALRSDFLPSLQSIPGFHSRLNGRLYLLSPLTAAQMRLAATCPATSLGVAFESGLDDQIVRDAVAGSLPLLEFTMAKLWETQRGKTLTFVGYHAMGGVGGALDRFAVESARRLTGTEAAALDRTLLKLVRTHGFDAGLATRQRVRKADVSDAEWEVLQRLADARLVILDTGVDNQPHAELAHDSLITSWARLRELLRENGDFLGWLAWARQRAEEGDPLPEARIAEARHWLASRPDDIPGEIRDFIQTSQTAIESRMGELRDARDRAEAQRLAADAELALRTARLPVLTALALATESVLTHPTVQGDQALRQVLRMHPRTHARLDHRGPVNAVAFSPDGSRVATACGSHGPGGTARVFDASTGAELARADHATFVRALSFSPDGTRVATASGNSFGSGGSARVFDASTGAELAHLDVEDPVEAVAFSPDGTKVAAGGKDRSARVFDASTGAELARLDHEAIVNAVAFSPDGTKVATATRHRLARVFEASTGAELARLDHEDLDSFDVVCAVAFSPDGTMVATGSGRDAGSGGSARLFDASTGAELVRFDHDFKVLTVAFSPDGTHVATGSHSDVMSGRGHARMFAAATGFEIFRLNHHGPVNQVAFSLDGTLVATASGSITERSGAARMFDASTGAELARLDHDSAVKAVAISPDGTRVATGSWGGSARIFEVPARVELTRLAHDRAVRAVAFSPDGSKIATVTGGHWAWIYDASTGTELDRLHAYSEARIYGQYEGVVTSVAFSPDGTRILIAGGYAGAFGCVQVFDATANVKIADLVHKDFVGAAAFSPDGSLIATVTRNASVSASAHVFEASSGVELARLDHGYDLVHAVAFSPDSTKVVTASKKFEAGEHSGSARVFEASSGVELARLEHGGTVNAVAFSPDGSRVIAATDKEAVGRGGSARLFEASTGAELACLDHEGDVIAAAFSPDGTMVVTASYRYLQDGGFARVFEASSGIELARLDHEGTVRAVAFSPDGTRVVAATGNDVGGGGSARLFEASTGAELARLDHEEEVTAVMFSPDGSKVATASRDGSVRVFETMPDMLAQRAIEMMSRPLDAEERRRYSLSENCLHDAAWRRSKSPRED
jgi:WD40 repeat protein